MRFWEILSWYDRRRFAYDSSESRVNNWVEEVMICDGVDGGGKSNQG